MSLRLNIVKGICSVLETIRKENGYNTDAGLIVRRGQQGYTGDEVTLEPMISIIEDPEMFTRDENQQQPNVYQSPLAFVLNGFCYDDPSNPSDTVYLILEDIQRAMAKEFVERGGRGQEPSNLFGLGRNVKNLQVGSAYVAPYESYLAGTQAAFCVVSMDYGERFA